MSRICRSKLGLLAVTLVGATVASAQQTKAPDPPPEGPFGYTLIRTADDALTDIDFFLSNETCQTCHARQFNEVEGSLHSAAHVDPLYRRFAELARAEVGEKVYTYCSGCHSAAGVTSGLIPAKHDPDLPDEAKAGVSCDVCHQISQLTGHEGPWKEPGNASFVLQQGLVKFGDSGKVAENRLHTGEKRDFFTKSEFCASCHTVIHPLNGMRIETTYDEWKSSVYAEKGIQCQDCHMRSVEDAAKVAETLKPVTVEGPRADDGEPRPIFPHYFVGGNANADRLANGPMHAEMAEQRLKSAARIELKVPANVAAGEKIDLEVTVHNLAAGHNIPTGVTELREMWVALRILDENGNVLVDDDGLDEQGEIREGVIRFGAHAKDASGKLTHKPWEMTGFLWKKTVPPKGSLQEVVTAAVPAGASVTIHIEARLLYRSAPPGVVAVVMQEDAFTPKIIEMSKTQVSVSVK
jgi:hypothetical protein